MDEIALQERHKYETLWKSVPEYRVYSPADRWIPVFLSFFYDRFRGKRLRVSYRGFLLECKKEAFFLSPWLKMSLGGQLMKSSILLFKLPFGGKRKLASFSAVIKNSLIMELFLFYKSQNKQQIKFHAE